MREAAAMETVTAAMARVVVARAKAAVVRVAAATARVAGAREKVVTGVVVRMGAKETAGVARAAAGTVAAKGAARVGLARAAGKVRRRPTGSYRPQQPVCCRSAFRRCRTCTTCLRCTDRPGRICPCTDWARPSWSRTRRKTSTPGTPGRCTDVEPRRYIRCSTCYTQCCRTPCRWG